MGPVAWRNGLPETPRLSSLLTRADPPARPDPLTARVGATFFRAAPARALVQDCVLRGLHALQEAEGLSVEMVSPDLGQRLSPGFPLSISVSSGHLHPPSGSLPCCPCWP